MVEIQPARLEAIRADHTVAVERCRSTISTRIHNVIIGEPTDAESLWKEVDSRRNAQYTLAHIEQLTPFLADPKRKARCLNIITQIFHEGGSAERILALDYLLAHMPNMHDPGIAYALSCAFEDATAYQLHQLLQRLEPMIKEPRNSYSIGFFLRARWGWYTSVLPVLQERWARAKEDPSSKTLEYLGEALESQYPAVQSAARRSMQALLPEGIPLSIIKFWQRDGTAESAIRQHLPAMLHLEKERPGLGICKTLYEDFGICQFNRYPASQLLTQFDERNSKKPYGIIAIGNDDHNGAFDRMRKECDSLSQGAAQNGMLLRVVEFSSAATFARRLLQLQKAYAQSQSTGDGHRIGFALIGTHGSTHKMHPGKEITMKHLLNDKAQQLIAECMEPGASICLRSCSTGKASDGVAATLSRRGLHVIGPDENAAGDIISIHADAQGGVRLTATYWGARAVEYRNGIEQNTA